MDNLNLIKTLNKRYKREGLKFVCAVNSYADYTPLEFKERFAGLRFHASPSSSRQKSRSLQNQSSQTSTKQNNSKKFAAVALPKSVDWRPKAVTSVKTQVC